VMATIFQSIDATLHYLLVTLAHIHSLPGSIIAALVDGALFDPVRHRTSASWMVISTPERVASQDTSKKPTLPRVQQAPGAFPCLP
jgi:hypothetical protein